MASSNLTPLRAVTDAASKRREDLLDKSLDLLASRYARLPVQPTAEQKTLDALKLFTKRLSDDELDWLAAAGPGGTLPAFTPDDAAGRGKNKP